MNSEEFNNRIEQALFEDIRRKNDGIDQIAEIMKEMPVMPFEDMAPLLRILLRRCLFLEKVIIHYYQLELAMDHISMMKQLSELGKVRGYGQVNAILASSPFRFLGIVSLQLLV